MTATQYDPIHETMIPVDRIFLIKNIIFVPMTASSCPQIFPHHPGSICANLPL